VEWEEGAAPLQVRARGHSQEAEEETCLYHRHYNHQYHHQQNQAHPQHNSLLFSLFFLQNFLNPLVILSLCHLLSRYE
jgi:hypothetical protein